MNEVIGNIWEGDVDAICITTNGTVLDSGHNIMGGGIAWEATMAVPGISLTHGRLIRHYGHRFQLLDIWTRPSDKRGIQLFAFPSKRTIDVNSDLVTILISLESLIHVAKSYPSLKFGLPRPGSNLGGLNWENQVRPLLEPALKDSPNIYVYHYSQNGTSNVLRTG